MGTCKYCNKSFVRDSTLSSHVCEQKRRHLAKDDKASQIGFEAFKRFYVANSPLTDGKKSFEDFATSPYYNAFVKFGSFINNIKPLYPSKFIDWVLKSGKKIDYWCDDKFYDAYVLELIYTEAVETALERSVQYMQYWAEDNNEQWNDYFRKVNTNIAIFNIKDGKISPWVLLNSKSGKTFLRTLRDDQLANISTVIDIPRWKKIFDSEPKKVELVKKIINAGNI